MTESVRVRLNFHGNGEAIVTLTSNRRWIVVSDPRGTLGQTTGGEWGATAGGTSIASRNMAIVDLASFRFAQVSEGDTDAANNHHLGYIGSWHATDVQA